MKLYLILSAFFALGVGAFKMEQHDDKDMFIKHLSKWANVGVAKTAIREFATPPKIKHTDPDFCHGLACPQYTVVHKEKDYELRRYAKSHWVTTAITGMDYEKASYKLFMRLFDYISGNNVKGEKIDMTAPVRSRIIPGQGPACESNFTLSFYIPKDVAATAPAPKDEDVHLETDDEFSVYVRYFPGYTNDIKVWISEALKLSESINGTASYEKSYWYACGYDSPFKFWNRHNEIWFMKK